MGEPENRECDSERRWTEIEREGRKRELGRKRERASKMKAIKLFYAFNRI